MNIIFVTSTLTSGGSERVMCLLANGLRSKGNEVEIICLNKHIVFYPVDKKINIIFAEEEINGTSILKKIIWFRKHVAKYKPDVVIPFMEAVYCFTLFSMIGMRVPVISSERIDPRRSPSMRNLLRRIMLPLTTHLVVQTEDIKKFYPSFIRNKTTVIYNPVTEKVFDESVIEKKDVIVSVGRLYQQKNQKLLIDAFGSVARDFDRFSLIIYGEGPLRKELERQIQDDGLAEKVFLPGSIDFVIDKIKEAKLFCLSSNYEGMSNALIEAICVGLPVISTKVSGVEELIVEGKNGIVVPVGDLSGFSTAIRDMLSNEKKMEAFGHANKQMAYKFKTECIVEQWEKLIKDIINNYESKLEEKN
jgi:Glycosyltransferase